MSTPRKKPKAHGGRSGGDQRDRRKQRGDGRGGQGARDTRGGADQRGQGAQGARAGGAQGTQRPARGGSGRPENELSIAARQRLGRLRAEYDPGDDDRPDPERDTYPDVPGGIRLQKALAQAGVASRRASEEMIAAGRVSVDGHTVRRFGARVDPERSEIRVDGMLVATAPGALYFALNKPRGVVSTMWDPDGRPTLADYTETEERLFHVGRLDTDTEGLILLTNDGALAHRLTHPSYEIVKTYVAKVAGAVPRGVVRRVRGGVELEDGPVRVDDFQVVQTTGTTAMVEVSLHEGRKHVVRRLLEAVGHPVQDLARTRVGPIELRSLKSGTSRALTAQEVSELYAAAGM